MLDAQFVLWDVCLAQPRIDAQLGRAERMVVQMRPKLFAFELQRTDDPGIRCIKVKLDLQVYSLPQTCPEK